MSLKNLNMELYDPAILPPGLYQKYTKQLRSWKRYLHTHVYCASTQKIQMGAGSSDEHTQGNVAYTYKETWHIHTREHYATTETVMESQNTKRGVGHDIRYETAMHR